MSSTKCQETKEFPWEDPGYREYMDPLLACGQVLARALGHGKVAGGAGLLADQLANTFQDRLFKPESLDPLLRLYKKENGASVELATRTLEVYQDHRYYRLGVPEEGGLAGLALLALLGAGYLLEGMPNVFSDIRGLFALINPAPSAWLPMIAGVRLFVQAKKPLVWVWDPRRSRRSCFGAHFGLTPRGMAFFGLPPSETSPRARTGAADELLFPERRAWARRMGDPPPDGQAGQGAGEHRRRPLEAKETPQEVLTLENPTLRLEDLVLPEEAFMEVAFAAKVLEAGGASPVMLFHGAPGTGKTHAARCLAGAAGRPLGVTSLDRLLVKWVGDTEKGIARAFAEAEEKGAILLLDEADALLYDRGTMYLSWQLSQVNTLLKLLEAPRIPVVLCTNFLRVLDSAVHRRIQHMVHFPIPGVEERRSLWGLALGEGAAEIDVSVLSAVLLTGGLIQNVVVQATRRKRVLGDGFTVCTETLLALARKELPKMERDAVSKTVGFADSRA